MVKFKQFSSLGSHYQTLWEAAQFASTLGDRLVAITQQDRDVVVWYREEVQ